MVRLRDIAERIGVSVMTVSRALRNSGDIAPATKARIHAVAQELGYVPDVTARGLRTRATHLLGAVIPSLLDPVVARVAAGLEERGRELGFDLLLAQSANLPDREDAGLRGLLARRVEGILIWPAIRLASTADVFDELRRRRVPVVMLSPPPPAGAGFLSVTSHDLPASQEAARHLLGLGHRRIVYFRGPAPSMRAQERFEGYRLALRESGQEVDDRLVFNAGNTVEDGSAAVLQMLHEGIRPTAIMAVNDAVAVGAGEALRQQGLRVPEDVSLVGFGNIPLAAFFRVPLTTVRQPKRELGMAAVDVMARALRGEAVLSARLPAQLVIRDSTAPPARNPPELDQSIVRPE